MSGNVLNAVLEGSQTKKGFIRDSLIKIYSAIDAPVTIDSLEISEAYESTYQLLSQITEYNLDVRAEIGYDRQEQYIAQETRYDSNLKMNVTKNVVKTRTVTDWQPYSTSAVKEGYAATELTNNDAVDLGEEDSGYNFDYDEASIIASGTASDNEEKINAIDFAEPTVEAVDHVITYGAIRPKVECKSEIPGDHSRNVNISYKATEASQCVYAVNRYKAAFTLDGKTHYTRQFVCEKSPQIFCNYYSKDDEIENIRDKCKEEIKNDPEFIKYSQYNKYTTYGIIGGLAIALILGNILGVAVILGALIAIASYIIKSKIFKPKCDNRKKEIQAKYDSMKDIHEKEVQTQKAEKLNARLSMMGMEPLSEQEMKKFLSSKHTLSIRGKSDHSKIEGSTY